MFMNGGVAMFHSTLEWEPTGVPGTSTSLPQRVGDGPARVLEWL